MTRLANGTPPPDSVAMARPTLLRIDSSADVEGSRSRALADVFVHAWRGAADGTVVVRDLHRDPVPHLEHSELHWPRPQDRVDQAPSTARLRQQVLVEELASADAVVVGFGLYNYSVPSSLKAWIDSVHLPGVTGGERGALRGRPAVLLEARGGLFDPGTRAADWDLGMPLLRIVFGELFGMTVRTVTVDLTLSGRIPALEGYRARSDAEFGVALDAAARLGTTVGRECADRRSRPQPASPHSDAAPPD